MLDWSSSVFRKTETIGQGRERKQASARSITSAITEHNSPYHSAIEVIDLVKWSENPNYVYLTERKNPPNSDNLIWNKERKEFPHY